MYLQALHDLKQSMLLDQYGESSYKAMWHAPLHLLPTCVEIATEKSRPINVKTSLLCKWKQSAYSSSGPYITCSREKDGIRQRRNQ